MNEAQKTRFTTRVVKELFHTIRGKKIAILGFAFKKDTGDTRCSPAITLVQHFRAEGALISIYDPKVKHHQYWIDLVDKNIPDDEAEGMLRSLYSSHSAQDTVFPGERHGPFFMVENKQSHAWGSYN